MSSDRAAKDAWITRVLGVSVGGGAASGDGPQPPANGVVAYRKLLLRWRDAQSSLEANLRTVGTTLLALPEIKEDPRLADIEKAVGLLPKLVPTFGGKLEDVLDAGLNATDPAEQARLSKEGVAAIDAYRQQLAAATELMRLEQFAAKDLGAGTELHGVLDQALVELKQQLAA